MNFRARILLVLLVATSNTLLASASAAAGRVVCFGFDGHIGIDSEQPREVCCQDKSSAEAWAATSQSNCPCIDILIPHGGKTLAAAPMTASGHDLLFAAAPPIPHNPVSLTLNGDLHQPDWPSGSSASHARLRAIVLLD